MRNLWIHTEHAFVTWIANFTAIARKPAAILEFVQAALVAGAKHRIFDVAEAPLIGYQRDRHGALGDLLGRLLERDRVLDLFGFTGAAMLPGLPRSSTVETSLWHYDREDQLVERVVTDQGALLASLEPVPGSIPNGCMTHYPAVRITGRRYVDVHEGVPVDNSSHPLPVAVLIAIHSDIWFPWVFGGAHPEADLRRMFDNRELASCHTPRLNAFLGEVAAAARRVGGSFGVWPDGTADPAIHWVDDSSVLLDWDPPDGIMPPEALNAEWY
jgi:hypothetical protein